MDMTGNNYHRTWWVLIYYNILLFLIITGPSLQCTPGRTRGSSRRHRKMTPLVFKQHVPNVSENTLGASGLAEGRIKRNDPAFSDLTVNYNPDIIFKDEEGTGADRIMSQRCKDKLNTLAISVMNRWPGVKLRVTEAWDEDMLHGKDSLHYEGRSVDITTSDRDTSKYGTLARLAVDAGFDWVYYSSRSHIHCSVKSDSSIASKTGGCFPGTSTVTLPGGISTPLSAVSPGDKILAMDENGDLIYSEILLFLDHNTDKRTTFYVIETEGGKNISLTPGHLIFVSQHHVASREVRPSFAGNVKVGDFIYWAKEFDSVRASKVTRIIPVVSRGAFAPLTQHGTVIVDGVVASCYAMVDSQAIAHMSFAPIRVMHDFQTLISGGSKTAVTNLKESKQGVHWYVSLLYNIGTHVLNDNYWFQL